MGRTKQTARKSTGGIVPRSTKQKAEKAKQKAKEKAEKAAEKQILCNPPADDVVVPVGEVKIRKAHRYCPGTGMLKHYKLTYIYTPT